MGRHSIIDEKEIVTIELTQNFWGHWRVWVRYPSGSGWGQSSPFLRRENAILHALDGLNEYHQFSEHGSDYRLVVDKYSKAIKDPGMDTICHDYVELDTAENSA